MHYDELNVPQRAELFSQLMHNLRKVHDDLSPASRQILDGRTPTKNPGALGNDQIEKLQLIRAVRAYGEKIEGLGSPQLKDGFMQAEGSPKQPQAGRFSLQGERFAYENIVRKMYDSGELARYAKLETAGPALPVGAKPAEVPPAAPVAAAPVATPAPAETASSGLSRAIPLDEKDPDNCLTPAAARTARIDATQKGDRDYAKAHQAQPQHPVASTKPGRRLASRAYMDGVTTYISPRDLKAVQAQTDERLQKKADRVQNYMKGTDIERSGLDVSKGEAIKLMAGNETKLTPYLLEAMKHGDIDLHAAAHPAQLAKLLDANPDMKTQFAIIARNEHHMTRDGQPDLKAISHQFAMAEKHAPSRRLAYTKANGEQARTARDLGQIAFDRTDNFGVAPDMAVAMKPGGDAKPGPGTKSAVAKSADAGSDFAKRHHMAPT